jgi:hypothetical protein
MKCESLTSKIRKTGKTGSTSESIPPNFFLRKTYGYFSVICPLGLAILKQLNYFIMLQIEKSLTEKIGKLKKMKFGKINFWSNYFRRDCRLLVFGVDK